jgi:hypothetical protein
MSPFVVKAFVLFLHSYKEEKHMRLATIWSVLIKCLLWKENLEGDGQQFHQKHKRPLLTSNHWTWKGHDIWTYDVSTPGTGFGQA